MPNNDFLLYGANGYTGELIARYATQYNLKPILAGRRKEALEPLANKLQLPFKVIDLADQKTLVDELRKVKVVVHAAGPFDITAQPMINACLQAGVHYLDINGDMVVFDLLHKLDDAAKKAGIMVVSGVGFDVVPTDCLALFLKNQLPDATSLQLAFATPGGALSHGTAITTAEKLGEPGAERKDGRIVPVPVGQKGRWVEFAEIDKGTKKKMFVMSLPWGDVFTAYFTTGIPNIVSYTQVSPVVYYLLKGQSLFNWLLRAKAVRNFVKKQIGRKAPGLTDEKRHKATSLVWGQVSNATGKTVTARLSGPDAYTLTALSSLLITQKILAGNYKTGYQTPAAVYSADLVLEIPGVHREKVF